jgi:hypothetical protein
MSRHALQMAAVLALAASALPTRDEERKRKPDTAADTAADESPNPEVERIKAELRERRRQNFIRQKK